ncbi:MAG: 5-oxoprolinase subunit PxpB [Planctomycetia bacterium]|nr:5-oxoprolinase subunit PxpB [Planctomycetia bacterium]
MSVVSVGDIAMAITVTPGSAEATTARVRAVAAAIAAAAIPGVVDIVASPERVTVAYAPLRIAGIDALRQAITTAVAAAREAATAARHHEVPVWYGGQWGPDFDEVCRLHGLDRKGLITIHTQPEYLVQAVGFMPGFAYLGGLDPRLATPRRSTPRTTVPVGSVGIGGSQTGVYPFTGPGGWNIIGRSPVRLFDPRRRDAALLAVGDRVRFVDAGPDAAAGWSDQEPIVPRPVAGGEQVISVIKPGLYATIQDLGRPGHRSAGVPLSGAADGDALRIANLLVGNPEHAAGIEFTLLGPELRFDRDAIVAVGGGDFPGLPSWRPVRIAAGTLVTLGHAVRGCRGVLAVAGGVRVEPTLDSRSTFPPARWGGLVGLPLVAGDRIPVGSECRAVEPAAGRDIRMAIELATPGEPGVLRLIPGEHAEAFGDAIWSATHRVSSRSDRMGMRLEGAALHCTARASTAMASIAVFPGTVQVPPDGNPIVLLADAQTIGGYPVIGHVITADLPRAAQLRPGDTVRWRKSSLDEAHAALREREGRIAALRESLTARRGGAAGNGS